jgi:hypothetical protein
MPHRTTHMCASMHSPTARPGAGGSAVKPSAASLDLIENSFVHARTKGTRRHAHPRAHTHAAASHRLCGRMTVETPPPPHGYSLRLWTKSYAVSATRRCRPCSRPDSATLVTISEVYFTTLGGGTHSITHALDKTGLLLKNQSCSRTLLTSSGMGWVVESHPPF